MTQIKGNRLARAGTAISGAFRLIPVGLEDVLTLGGIGAAAYGFWLRDASLGYIVGGLCYGGLGLLMVILNARRTGEES